MSGESDNMSTGYGPRRLIFNGDERNYELFEVKFLGYLKIKKLDDVIKNIEDLSDANIDDEKNSQVFAELVQVLDDRSLSLIIRDSKNNGRKAIRILRAHYLPKGKPRIITLYTELTSMVKGQNESITDYLIRAETAAACLKDAGEIIQDSLLVSMLLKGLPQSYKSFTTVITQREKPISFPDFKISLRNYEDTEKLGQQNHASSSKAPSVMTVSDRKSGNQKRWCEICKATTHDTKYCRKLKDFQAKQDKTKWCDICKNASHETKECRRLQKFHEMKLEEEDSDASDNSSYFFSLDSASQTLRPSSFLVDSGATTHVVNDKSKFIKFNKHFKSTDHTIELADGTRTNSVVKGQGDAKAVFLDETGCRRSVTLKNALYIPSFGQNIFSVKSATDNGASVHFSKNCAKLTSNQTVFNIEKEGQLYFLNTSVQKSTASHTLYEWHILLGHCNKSDLLKLEENCVGMHISDKSDFDCEICTLSKMTDSHNRQPDTSASENFELVHTDLAGPVEPSDINGMNYSLICVDSFSKFAYPYFLRQKSDAHKAFSQYLAEIAPYGQVKSVRSDVGGEFIAENFKSVLTENKIKQQKTAPYSPHQNGKAERTWRSLFEMARCLLLQSGLPKTLWTYAVMAAAYIRNRCYHKNIGCTPFEKVTGKKPNIANMEAFGSTCFALVQNPKKMENRSEKGVFIGFDKGSPAHLVYFPETETVKKVRCVKFPKHSQLSQGGNGYVDLPFELDVSNTNKEKSQNDENQNLDNSDSHSQSAPDLRSESVGESSESRNVRKRNKPKYLNDYALDRDIDDAIHENQMHTTIHYCYNANFHYVPQSYPEAITSSEASEWDLAMNNEMQALEENNTFELVSPPKDKKVIGSKWVYAIKTDKNGQDHFKARFVAKGFSQVEGIDYQETFSPTARMNSIRVISQIAVKNDLEIHQMDVKAAYLNAPIDCDVYIKQPEGFVKGEENENLVLKLKKSLYGLKQSGRNWNNTLDTFLKEEGFERSLNDPCFYTRDDNTFLVHWVDDIIIAAKPCTLKSVKTTLERRFKMKDLGKISYFLGIEFEIESGKLTMCQSRYISKVLDRFGMHDCKPRSTPCEMNPSHKMTDDSEPLDESNLKRYRQMVGSLIYIMTSTRPDIAYTVTKLSQFMSCATQYHMTMTKHILRYLKGTIDDKLIFTKSDKPFEIVGFSDSDWAGSIEDRKSITGYSFRMCDNGPLISWRAQKQQTVALSSCEAEYMALCSAVQEGKYLMSFLNEVLNLGQTKFTLYGDNQGASALAKNPVNHKRSKHIDIRFHFIRDEISEDRLCLKYVPSGENIADIFTKPVNAVKLKEFKPLLMGWAV